MEKHLALLSFYIAEDDDGTVLCEITELLESASQPLAVSILSYLKGILKSKSKSFTQKTQVLKILQAGFNTLNMTFVSEASVILLSRLRSLAEHPVASPGWDAFYSFLLFCFQDWANKFGSVSDEETLFMKVYMYLLAKDIVFPPVEDTRNYIYLKEIIDLRGALYKKNMQQAKKYRDSLRHLRRRLKEEILIRTENGVDTDQLLELNQKMNNTLQMYSLLKEDSDPVLVSATLNSDIDPILVPALEVIEIVWDPKPKSLPVSGMSVDSMLAEGTCPASIGNDKRIEDFDVEIEVPEEWHEIRQDYCRTKDYLHEANKVIENLSRDVAAHKRESRERKRNQKKLKRNLGELQKTVTRLQEKLLETNETNCQLQELLKNNSKPLKNAANQNFTGNFRLASPSEELREESPVYANFSLWLKSLSRTHCILYENHEIQVGVRTLQKSDYWLLNLYIGNRCSMLLEGLSTHILCPHADLLIKINSDLEKKPLAPGKTVNRTIAFKILHTFESCPLLKLSYSGREHYLLLPITPLLEFTAGPPQPLTNAPLCLTLKEQPLSLESVAGALNFHCKFHTELSQEHSAVLQCANATITIAHSTEMMISVDAETEHCKELIFGLVKLLLSP